MGWLAAMVAILVGAFMVILDTSIVNVAIPTMMNAFGVSVNDIEWVATAYMLALGVVVPASGWLGDYLGYKRLYMASLFFFTVGSLLCGLAWNLPSMIAARVVQAVGGGMVMPTTMAMVYRMVPRERLGAAMGIWGLALLLAPAVGPTLGGYLVEYLNWRLIFTINLPVGVAGLLLAAAVLPEFKDDRPGAFDVWGFLTAAVGLFTLLLALSEGSAWGWRSEAIVMLFYASAASLALFVWIELTHSDPLLDLRVFRYGTFTLSSVTVVIITIGLFSGVFFVPLFLQTVRGLRPFDVGILMLPGALATGAVMPVSGRLYDRFGPRLVVTAGLGLLVYSTLLLHRLTVDTPERTIAGWMVLRGIGMGLAMMPSQTAGMSVIPTHLISRASAVNNIIQRVAGSFGIAWFGSILERRMAFHVARLSEAVTPDSLLAWTAQVTPTGVPGGDATQLLGTLAGRVGAESMVAAMGDVFLLLAVVCAIGLVPALLLRRAGGMVAAGRGPMAAVSE